MTDLRKAAEMALERLESHEYWMDEKAIKALRQALAQPEWIGLTHEEAKQLVEDCDWYNFPVFFCFEVEAKLKEKNT